MYGIPQRPWWTLQVTIATCVLENQPYTKTWPCRASVTNKTKLQTQIVNCLSHWPFNNTLPAKRGQGDKTKQNSTPKHSSRQRSNPFKSPITFIIIHTPSALHHSTLHTHDHQYQPLSQTSIPHISSTIFNRFLKLEACKWKQRSVSFSGIRNRGICLRIDEVMVKNVLDFNLPYLSQFQIDFRFEACKWKQRCLSFSGIQNQGIYLKTDEVIVKTVFALWSLISDTILDQSWIWSVCVKANVCIFLWNPESRTISWKLMKLWAKRVVNFNLSYLSQFWIDFGFEACKWKQRCVYSSGIRNRGIFLKTDEVMVKIVVTFNLSYLSQFWIVSRCLGETMGCLRGW